MVRQETYVCAILTEEYFWEKDFPGEFSFIDREKYTWVSPRKFFFQITEAIVGDTFTWI